MTEERGNGGEGKEEWILLSIQCNDWRRKGWESYRSTHPLPSYSFSFRSNLRELERSGKPLGYRNWIEKKGKGTEKEKRGKRQESYGQELVRESWKEIAFTGHFLSSLSIPIPSLFSLPPLRLVDRQERGNEWMREKGTGWGVNCRWEASLVSGLASHQFTLPSLHSFPFITLAFWRR